MLSRRKLGLPQRSNPTRTRRFHQISRSQPAATRLSVQAHAYEAASMSQNSACGVAVVIMGVSGCGKSTVGALLAEKLQCPFYDADDYHPPENIRKMRAGVPLTDDDRLPWLQRLADLINQHVQQGTHAVLACSALKPTYRQVFRDAAWSGVKHTAAATLESAAGDLAASQKRVSSAAVEAHGNGQSMADAATMPGLQAQQKPEQQAPVAFVLLNPSKAELLQRVQQRAALGKHFMPPSLLEDQLKQLSYDASELLMCFGGNCCNGSNTTHPLTATPQQQSMLGDGKSESCAFDADVCGQLPTTEQMVGAILQRLQRLSA